MSSVGEKTADRFSHHTEIVPTVVDTTKNVPSSQRRDEAQPIVVGWIGSPSTWTFVQPVMPILQRLSEELNLIIRVVGAGRPPAPSFRFEFVEWSEDTEISALQSMDIGIMPLPDDPWARGKCGLKLIQYMACGLPVIASPVGVNCDLVEEGVNGLLASNERDWEAAIRRLVASSTLRANLGARGRKKVVDGYSLHVYGPRLAALVRGRGQIHCCIDQQPQQTSKRWRVRRKNEGRGARSCEEGRNFTVRDFGRYGRRAILIRVQ